MPHFGLLNPIFYLHVSVGVRITPGGHPSDLLICGPVMSILSLEGALDLFVCFFFTSENRTGQPVGHQDCEGHH